MAGGGGAKFVAGGLANSGHPPAGHKHFAIVSMIKGNNTLFV